MATQTLVSLEEYLALAVKKGVSYEYDEGRVIEVPAHKLENARIQACVIRVLGNRLPGSAFCVAGPTGFWLTPEVECIPDACVLRGHRIKSMEVFDGSLRGAPDLAVEIVSSGESAAELERKIDQYLAAGTLVVVLVYPESRHVWLCRPGGETRRLGAGDTLEIPELPPGLSILVDELFSA